MQKSNKQKSLFMGKLYFGFAKKIIIRKSCDIPAIFSPTQPHRCTQPLSPIIGTGSPIVSHTHPKHSAATSARIPPLKLGL